MTRDDLNELARKAETGEQWAEVCRLEAMMVSAKARYGAIKDALRQGHPELADAIDQERQCSECGAFVSDDGYSVDPNKSCFYCSP